MGILLLLVAGVFTLLVFFDLRPYNYWAKKNVKTGKIIPIVGDYLPVLLGTIPFADSVKNWYNKVSNVRYIGIYELRIPILLLKSPELIKQIFIKDFDYFTDHSKHLLEAMDEFSSTSVVILKGQHWKAMHSILTPSFTSSKIKTMFGLAQEKAELLIRKFLEKNEEIVEVDFLDTARRFSNDVMTNAFLGIQGNSLTKKDDMFYKMMRESNDLNTLSKKIIFFLMQQTPSICALLGIQYFDKNTKEFFINVVKDTIRLRQEQDIKRSDMLGLLLKAREEQKKNDRDEMDKNSSKDHPNIANNKCNLGDVDVAAQIFITYLAGFDALSTALSFMAYELAANPDIQKKLMQEIDEIRPKSGPPSYDNIAKLEYLEMVISETLRKWPITPTIDRLVTKPYIIEPEHTDEQPVHLDVDDVIMVPVYAIHRDPEYFPEPEKFDPERFNSENRKTIKPYTYLPFGFGPRECIGENFCYLLFKVLFFYLLSDLEIVPVEKTKIPLKISRTGGFVTSANGFPFGFKRRDIS